MVIRRGKKVEPIVVAKESGFERRWREAEEKREREKQEAEQKELDRIAEKEHVAKLIIHNLQTLGKQLDEKDLGSFWVFPDKEGFKKVNGLEFTQMQKKVNKNKEKYIGRKMVFFSICEDYKKPEKYKRDDHFWLSVAITVFIVDDEGKLQGKKTGWDYVMAWQDKDFKITKLTFKFLEAVMRQVVDKKLFTMSIFGVPLTTLVKKMEKKGIDISDSFSPLAGV